eukprot:25123-Eustigmatos_ZCMA.PRE.1
METRTLQTARLVAACRESDRGMSRTGRAHVWGRSECENSSLRALGEAQVAVIEMLPGFRL